MTTRHRFFRINGVDRAGTPWIECTMMDPRAVLDRLAYLRSLTGRNKSHDRMYWVDDPDDEERGDIEQEMEEAIEESDAQLAIIEARYVTKAPGWEVRAGQPGFWAVDEQRAMGGSRGDGGLGPEGISGYGLSNPVQLTDREREPSFSLRSIPYRVFVWRWKTRLRRVPWGTLIGMTLMLCSAAFSTWLILNVAEWMLR